LPRLAPVGGSVQIDPGATLHNQYPRRGKMRPILVDHPVLPWYDIASTGMGGQWQAVRAVKKEIPGKYLSQPSKVIAMSTLRILVFAIVVLATGGILASLNGVGANRGSHEENQIPVNVRHRSSHDW
jgi:hypothetical protein